MVQSRLKLVAKIGGAVRHEKELRAAFFLRFDHVWVPGIFTDRHADAHTFHRHGALHHIAREQAHLVKDVEIGQEILVHHMSDLAALQHEITVMQLEVFANGRPTDAKRGAICTSLSQLGNLGIRGLDERGFHDQILRLIAGDKHLGQRHQIGTSVLASLPRRARFGSIASQVAHGGVQLRQRYAKSIRHVDVSLFRHRR